MKNYKGTAKVKDSSTYVYKGHTFDVIGIYMEYKNGNGSGVYADGTREYKLSLLGTEFEGKNFGTMTVVHEKELENIELWETIVFPLDELETLQLIQFTKNCALDSKEAILEAFISENTKKSVLPIPDLNTIYDEAEFNRRLQLKATTI